MTGQIVVQSTRDLIRGVADRWRSQYGDTPRREDHLRILGELDSLDGETATADDVERIIGNRTWTRVRCDVCGDDSMSTWVRLGEEPDYGSITLTACAACLARALEAIKAGTP